MFGFGRQFSIYSVTLSLVQYFGEKTRFGDFWSEIKHNNKTRQKL